jgi:NAD(P)H-nitrite reductase large subunit
MDLTSLGEATAEDGAYVILRRVDERSGKYQRLTLHDGVIVGAILLGETRNLQSIRQVIASKRDITPWQDRLLDPEFDLRAIAQGTLPHAPDK